MISENVYKQVPQIFDRLVRQGEFEAFGETIPDSTYQERMQRVKGKISEEGLDALFVFADCYRMSNARWLVDYRIQCCKGAPTRHDPVDLPGTYSPVQRESPPVLSNPNSTGHDVVHV
jgi:hypothetical protein